MGVTLTDVLLFGKAQSDDVDNATLVIYRRNILRWSALGGYLDIIVKGVAPLSLPDAIANSLQYVKAFGGTEQRDIPDNYLQRQFVYMMDGSYLLTDIVPTYDGRIEMDFQTTSIPSGSVYFVGGRTETYGGLFIAKGSDGIVLVDSFGNRSSDRYNSGVSLENNTRYKFIYDNKVATLESGGTTLFTNTSTGENANGAALCINGLNFNGTVSGAQAGNYLYSFKAWNAQGELVADYVPAIQKGTVPVVGFYDTVSKTFKTATAGTFAAGGEAVPTPDTPMDIVSNNGVLKVNSQGQIYTDGTVETIAIVSSNLLNPANIHQGSINTNTGAVSSANNRCYFDYIKVKTGDSIWFSAKNDTPPIFSRVCFYSDTNEESFVSSSGGTSFTFGNYTGAKFTAPINGYVRGIFLQSANFTPADVTDAQVVIQESAPTNYIPYNDSTATAEMLLKVGNYQDVQSIIDGVVTRNVGVKVFDGTENWMTGTGGVWYNFQGDVGAFNTTAMICSHYSYAGAQVNIVDMSQNQFSSYANGNIAFKSAETTSADDFKTWLADKYNAGTPVMVVYAKTNPATESVTGQTLQVTDGDNTLEITQASLNGLELEAKYQASVSLTIQEVQDANLDPNVEVTIN